MLLDTNAYSALARGLPSMVTAIDGVSNLKLPLPVIAELRYGFVKGTQAARNEEALQRFLAQPQITIVMPTLKTTEYYAELRQLCQQRGRALSHNDTWIAALTQETGETLVTFDQDFTVFGEVFGDRLIILT